LDSSARQDDPELRAVADELMSHDPDGLRVARVLRRTYDMLLDGQHTGRYRWDQLYKTEKTHFGTLVEINLQREFGFIRRKVGRWVYLTRHVQEDTEALYGPNPNNLTPEERMRGLGAGGGSGPGCGGAL